MTQKVIFTDIDGTILDESGGYGNTPRIISSLMKDNVPVILCSAKTLAEQVRIRKELGLNDPFIIENGGAIVFEKGYFDNPLILGNHRFVEHNDEYVIELGKPATQIRELLNDIRTKFNLNFKGVADTSMEELASLTNLSTNHAKEMSRREYGETILQIDERDLVKLTNIARDMDLNIIHGGRFFDVTMGNDKGKAVELLIKLFKKKYNEDVIFFGIGDSENDASMLRHMDHPILVQKTDGSWSNIAVKGVIKVAGIGPTGWALAYEDIARVI
ncbi:MAG TPA: HAD-IIB family hydrolase [Nitrososphaeraceae archaeon]|jgi:mannosyl-3-phosphoglycerate phosphatase family protein